MPLHYQEVRKLSLAPGSHPRELSFLSAASGLVRVRDKLYVIADDELHLGVFRVDREEPLKLVRLFDGDLPESPKKRKSSRPISKPFCFFRRATRAPADRCSRSARARARTGSSVPWRASMRTVTCTVRRGRSI